MAAEGVRVYVLAKELRVKITDVLAVGKSLGVPLRGLMSVIPTGRRAEVAEHLKPSTPLPRKEFEALFSGGVEEYPVSGHDLPRIRSTAQHPRT
jgi:hypothetical protein